MTEGFEEYLRERRESGEQTRRLLISALAVTCVALAIANVVLALWLTSGRTRRAAEAPARIDRAQPPRTAGVAETPPPSVTLPKTTEPVPVAPRGASTPTEPSARPDPPPPRVDPPPRVEPPLRAAELPPRSPVAAAAAGRSLASGATTTVARPRVDVPPPSAPGLAAPEEATAAWMLTTYGRPAAEDRARAALDFYTPQSAESRYWRRVLALIVAAR